MTIIMTKNIKIIIQKSKDIYKFRDKNKIKSTELAELLDSKQWIRGDVNQLIDSFQTKYSGGYWMKWLQSK